MIYIENLKLLCYASRMLGAYRRDLISKSFFRVAEIFFGATTVYVWFSPKPIPTKLALGAINVLIFVSAIAISPKQSPEKGR